MAGPLAGKGHAYRTRRGGKPKTIVETMANGIQAAGSPFVQVSAASKRIAARSTASVRIGNW